MDPSSIDPQRPLEPRPDASRRGFLLLGLGLLAGCSTGHRGDASTGSLWADPRRWPAVPEPVSPVTPTSVPAASIDGGLSRRHWAGGHPVPRLMSPMAPPRSITVHHDGMSSFKAIPRAEASERLERIRRAHRARGWGDIGYHYAIDPSGRVWQARPMQWQGAHVRDHNVGNIGIVMLGNYDLQPVTGSQRAALTARISSLMQRHGISLARVRTHQELAPTRCPGITLQRCMNAIRTDGTLA